jgi:hypothetical protein
VGDEGGFAPNLKSNEEALEVVMEAITQAGYKPGEQIGIALDPAASEFFKDGKVHLQEVGQERAHQRADGRVLGQLAPPVSHRSPSKTAWPKTTGNGWKLMTDTLGANTQLVGDDLFVTNTERLKRGIEMGVANSILIKVNQIGTLTETLDCHADGVQERLHGGRFAPFGRDRRSVYRRSRGGHERRPDQDRIGQPHRPHRQIQPVAAHRRASGQRREVPRPKGVSPIDQYAMHATEVACTQLSRNKPLILTILDGWGFSPAVEGNAIAAARKPTYDMLLRDFPNTLVQTSGPSVGLPKARWGTAKWAI